MRLWRQLPSDLCRHRAILRDRSLSDPQFVLFLVSTTAAFAGLSWLAGRRALARLLPRLLILTALVLVPLIFYRFNWQSYLPPKILVLHFLSRHALRRLSSLRPVAETHPQPGPHPPGRALPDLVPFFVAGRQHGRIGLAPHQLQRLFRVHAHVFHYARAIHFLRLCVNLSCVTQIAMSIFGMMQISRKIPEKYVFTHDQAVSTIGNVNFCSYYLDVVLPVAGALLIYNFMRYRRTWMFALIAAVEVVLYNYVFYEIGDFPRFIAGTLVAYLLLSAMEWIALSMADRSGQLSLPAFLTTKLYVYSLLFGFLHLFVIDSRGSHVGVLTCLVAMISTWAYFQGAFDLTRLFQRKEHFSGTPSEAKFNWRVSWTLISLLIGCVVVAGVVITVAGYGDSKLGNRWLTAAKDPIVNWMPQWFFYFSGYLFNIFAIGLLLVAVLIAWALVTWVFKQPGYAAASSRTPEEPGENRGRFSQTDRTIATAWAVSFGVALLVGAGLIYLTYQGNARVTELHLEQGYELNSTLPTGETVALPGWLDFWSSLEAIKSHGLFRGMALAALILGGLAALLFLAALVPMEYTPENLRRTTVLLLISAGLAVLCVLAMPLALAYRLAFAVLLVSFYLILYNAVRHVSLRRVEESTTSHWLGMTALNTLLPMLLLVIALGFHHPTILNIWRGKLKDFSSTDLNTILFRFEIWKKTSRMIFDCDAAGVTDFANNNFLFGIGAGNFKVIELWFTALPENRVLGKEVLARDPHSYYFLVASEAGVFGVIAMFWLFLVIGWTMIRYLQWSSRQVQRVRLAPEHKRMPRVIHQYSLLFYLMWGFFGAFMATVAHCAFEFNWTQPASATLIYFTAAAALGLSQASWRKEREAIVFESARQQYLKESPYTDAQQRAAAAMEKGDPFDAFAARMAPRAGLASLVALLLVVALFHTGARHFMGENYLKWGMIFQETDTDGNPNDGLMLRYYTDMFRSFRRAIELWPQQMEIFYILGRYHIDIAHDIESMIRIQDSTQQAQRVNWARLAGLDVTVEGLERSMEKYLLEGARTHFVDIYMNPNYKWAHNNQGVTMDMLGRLTRDPNSLAFEVARQAYERALIIDTEQIYALFNLGLGYMRRARSTGNTDDWQKAIDLLERASLVDPSKPETFSELASAYANTGQYAKAQETLLRWGQWARENVAKRPRDVLSWSNADILLRIAKLELQSGRYRLASQYLDMLEKIAPGDPEVGELRAEVVYLLGDYGRAKGLLEERVKKNPTAELHYRLATCLVKLEDYFEASLSLQRAFSANPALKQQFRTDPNFDAVREKPEFKRLLE
ncbi:tetratricopeptide repeat protein [bacterium]|nr:tetratricopeptide repeat protein [bacterium]